MSVGHLHELLMDQHLFVLCMDNLREKHLPLGGDAMAHSVSLRWEGQWTHHEPSQTIRSHPSLSKGLPGCAALQHHSSRCVSPHSQAAPLCTSPPPFCAILILISRFSDSLTIPSNRVARQSHHHSALTLCALSRSQLFKWLHHRSEPASYSLNSKYQPENTKLRSCSKDFPLIRNQRLGWSQRAVSVLGFNSKREETLI